LAFGGTALSLATALKCGELAQDMGLDWVIENEYLLLVFNHPITLSETSEFTTSPLHQEKEVKVRNPSALQEHFGKMWVEWLIAFTRSLILGYLIRIGSLCCTSCQFCFCIPVTRYEPNLYIHHSMMGEQ
jgi:hypothetical protein